MTPPLRVSSLPPPLAENPYQHLLYTALGEHGIEYARQPDLDRAWLRPLALWRARRDIDVLHIHWPQGLYRCSSQSTLLRAAGGAIKTLALPLRLAVARALGYRVVWTVHQVLPHDHATPRLDRLAAHALGRGSHLLIAHDTWTADDVQRSLGARVARKLAIIPIGSYAGVYPSGRPRDEVRARLGLAPDAFAFLCFGAVRGYKQIDVILRAFADADLPSAALVIAGPPLEASVADEVRRAAAADARIVTLLEHVPDEDVAELFDACDAAVFARPGGTSSALVLALSLGLPVVAPANPDYAEMTGSDEAGWLFDSDDGGALSVALERAAADPEAARAKRPAAARRAARLAWAPIAQRTAELWLHSTKRAPQRRHDIATEVTRS